ncbi:unnamed protein product [Pocillopora meandrina]|uniref:DED domain-containing protein n=1 Tax=Pocillopora meandrina TaxID=46732 RepID=A0AAU9VZ18_9CNID|nr:unnamed protein product [Pocillopora meandrina]
MASAKDENCISPYRRLLLEMSMELSNKDLERLMYAVGDRLPRRLTENIESGLKLFEALEQDVHIGPQNLTLLYDGFKAIGRVDLAQSIQVFSRKLHKADDNPDETDDQEKRNHVGYNIMLATYQEKRIGLKLSRLCLMNRIFSSNLTAVADEHVMTFRSVVDQQHLANPRSTSTGLSGGNADGRTAEHLVAVRSSSLESARGPCPAPSRDFVLGSSARLQPDPAAGPAPARYVNFLVHEGYVVEILGGKHYKTPDGEFVEMKSGTQYKIHVKNSHAYGCHVDISIDGYDVGGWALRRGEEMSIERPAYEAKKFTFYRVKTAPKEAGIESGRPENGVVKCVFIPEAFVNIPVITSDSSQPLNVSMPPSATVGDLKRKLQHQMGVMDDPYQVLAKSDKVLSNGTRLRDIIEKPMDLRLIDAEISITVTAEACSNCPFPIKVHPGKVKVHYLMEQIEGKIQVPIRDQKLYHEGNLLSAAPSSYLPDKLICSPRPAVNVIIPEYIHITVEDQSGHSHSVKVDKEKNLKAVIEEITLRKCRVTFVIDGREFDPNQDKGPLQGIFYSSKLIYH